MGALLDHVRSYYEALNTGDADRVSAHLTEDAVHYYTRLGPHEGARAIGEHTRWAVGNIEGQWFIEDAVDREGVAVGVLDPAPSHGGHSLSAARTPPNGTIGAVLSDFAATIASGDAMEGSQRRL